MHSAIYNPTYYKYNISKSKVCRFDFSKPKILTFYIDDKRLIQLDQDNLWVNLWSLAIASLISSNHNINFISSSIKILVFVYYITNYAIKGDYSQYQRIMAIAIIKKAFEDQKKPGPGPLSYIPNLD